jgi:Fe2+ or Zn2+ uptake regulation protein
VYIKQLLVKVRDIIAQLEFLLQNHYCKYFTFNLMLAILLNMNDVLTRNTKYRQAIQEYLSNVGHATNAEILQNLRKTFPDLSATTVHRLTTRMCRRGEISLAPKDSRGSLRYDANNTVHDHFLCQGCDQLRDVQLADKLRPMLEKQMGDCCVNGNFVISGLCNSCKERE